VIEEYLKYLDVKGYAKATIHTIRKTLGLFSSFIDYDVINVTPDAIDQYLAFNQDRHLNNSTIVGRIRIISRFFKYLKQEGHIILDPTIHVELRYEKSILHDIPSHAQVEKLLLLPDIETLTGKRDKAILELMYSSGLRRQELVNLDIYDLNLKKKELFVREGKGGRDRVTPIGREAITWLDKYINIVRPRYTKDPNQKALFLSVRGGRLSPSSVFDILERYYKSKKIDIKISPHKLRHACAIGMLKNNADIRMIQRLLGHRRLTSTQVYTTVTINDLKHVHDKYHPRRAMRLE